MTHPATSTRWTTSDAVELYRFAGWANEYFSVSSAGRVLVHPRGPRTQGIDLHALVEEVRERDIHPPLLLRFSEILEARIAEIHRAFQEAIDAYGYGNLYRGVYPIKVNQDRFVVDRLVESGRPFHFGLEAGSKPELLAILATLHDPEALIICNGAKDREFLETALLASKLGRKVILVVEKPTELALIADCVAATSVRPRLGLRARLTSRGAGHWQQSGGDRSKFGLGSREILDAISYLRDQGLDDCLELLHFHIGSQISSIRAVKGALREASWIYVSMVRMGLPVRYLDVGGGLGVDYDGSRTSSSSSINYDLQEYANDIVSGIMEVCDPAEVPHPTIVSESGRATVAHHAVLVFEVLGVTELAVGLLPRTPPPDAAPPLQYLFEAYGAVDRDNLLETYHDIGAYRDECLTLFGLGHLSLEHRGLAEDLYWVTCRRILDLLRGQEEIPGELAGLEGALADTYFCNFSLFQSIPDSWAIDQIFPVVPLQRLDQEPVNRAVLADITCDSDGTLDHFIGDQESKRVLELHPLDGNPYYIGIFLVGAYQEILGDLHNLFGDTNVVGVSLHADGGFSLDDVARGDSVSDVLQYVHYRSADLVAGLRRAIELALREKRLTFEESRRLLRIYEEGLAGYTYLEP